MDLNLQIPNIKMYIQPKALQINPRGRQKITEILLSKAESENGDLVFNYQVNWFSSVTISSQQIEFLVQGTHNFESYRGTISLFLFNALSSLFVSELSSF